MFNGYHLSSRYIQLKNDSKWKNLADVGKKSVPTSNLINEEQQLDLDYKMMIETSQITVSSSESLENPVPDTTEISSNNEKVFSVSKKIFDDPPPSMASGERIEHSVPDMPEMSPSKELDCVYLELVQDPSPSTVNRGRIEENELLVPVMIEPTSAAASQNVSVLFSLIFFDLTVK